MAKPPRCLIQKNKDRNPYIEAAVQEWLTAEMPDPEEQGSKLVHGDMGVAEDEAEMPDPEEQGSKQQTPGGADQRALGAEMPDPEEQGSKLL